MPQLKVMLATEGTYPYHQGGVSTWCNILVQNLTEIDFVIYSIIMNPFVTQKFALPPSSSLIKVPLWGTEEPSEHLPIPFSHVYIAKRQTGDKVVADHFIPLFVSFLEEILSEEKNPHRFAAVLFELYRYFQEYDYKKSFKSELTWKLFKKMVAAYTSDPRNNMDEPSVFALIQSLGWIYRFFNILNTPIPRVDVAHSAAAAFCGIPCVLAKVRDRTPFLLTEHGVYLREQYLYLAKRGYPPFLSAFLMGLLRSVAGLNYAFADQVSPVCHYNTRWEKKFGVKPDLIKVIYNGVDKDVFTPSREQYRNKYPTVVSVARIDPVKDQLTLIRAAAIVKTRFPDVRFIVYGSVTVPEYYEQCLQLVQELDLKENFIFAGHTTDIPSAYRSGDVIALSSITEAFPYSVIEAMMSGKAIVATNVGGIKEALDNCGILVDPREPEQFARALITLLENPVLRYTMGEEGRQRGLNLFTIDRMLELYRHSYRRLAAVASETEGLSPRLSRQRLMVERGYALLQAGCRQEAISQFRSAIAAAPDSRAVPVILIDIAGVYNDLGQFDRAFWELEKAEVLMRVIRRPKSA